MENKKCLKPPTSIYIQLREPNWENDVIDIYKPTNLGDPVIRGMEQDYCLYNPENYQYHVGPRQYLWVQNGTIPI